MSSYSSNLWKMYLLKFFSGLHFTAGIIVPFFMQWGGLSFSEVLILQALFVFALFVFEIPTGALADYFGRKHTILIAGFFGCLGALMYTIKPSFWYFLLGETLWALAVALLSGADQALLYDSLKQIKKEHESKKVLSYYECSFLFGILVAAPIGSLLGASVGYPWTFYLTGLGFLAATATGFFLKEPPHKRHGQTCHYWTVLKNGMQYFHHHKILRILAFDGISISAFAFLIFWMAQLKLMELNFDIAYLGFVHMSWLVFEISIATNFAFFENLVGSKRRYLFLSAIIPGLGFIALAFTKTILVAIPILIVMGTFAFTRPFLFNHYMQKYIESHHRATVMSTINMVRALARGVVYVVLAGVFLWSHQAAFIIAGLGIIMFSLISKVEEDMLID